MLFLLCQLNLLLEEQGDHEVVDEVATIAEFTGVLTFLSTSSVMAAPCQLLLIGEA